jgi:hypothetical protein
MPFAGIITRNGIVRGSEPVAAVCDQQKRRATLEARGRLVNALQRKLYLGDTEAVARAEDNFDRVYVEAYGRLPDTLRHRPGLSPMQLRRRTAEAKLKRERAKFDANEARRKRADVGSSRGRILNSTRPPIPGAENISLEQLAELCRANEIFM